MTDLMEQAISRIRDLPSEMQDEFAELLLRLAEERDETVYRLTPEELADLDVSISQADRREFATEDEVKRVFAKYAR
jgi:hypothetical protein